MKSRVIFTKIKRDEYMKVAVVSSDGKVINQHFGKASRFLIFEVNCDEIRFIEVRETIPLFGSTDYGHADEV